MHMRRGWQCLKPPAWRFYQHDAWSPVCCFISSRSFPARCFVCVLLKEGTNPSALSPFMYDPWQERSQAQPTTVSCKAGSSCSFNKERDPQTPLLRLGARSFWRKKNTWNISLQNTSPACLTVSFTDCTTAGPTLTECSINPVRRKHVFVF